MTRERRHAVGPLTGLRRTARLLAVGLDQPLTEGFRLPSAAKLGDQLLGVLKVLHALMVNL
jgi:hypothetical protein